MSKGQKLLIVLLVALILFITMACATPGSIVIQDALENDDSDSDSEDDGRTDDVVIPGLWGHGIIGD